jgi:hypothetical protein
MTYYATNLAIASLLWTFILGGVALAAWALIVIAGSRS